eukprot:5215054-Karenia_brevis.AAC.1
MRFFDFFLHPSDRHYVATTTKYNARMHFVGYTSSFVHFALVPCLTADVARHITTALLSMHKVLNAKQCRAFRSNELH